MKNNFSRVWTDRCFKPGSCYFCFDNIFCILCLNVACQFRILQYRIANAPMLKKKENLDSSKYPSDECYNAFKNYIQQHQALLDFCETLEQIFTIIVVGQILMFSILFCFLGYQVILVSWLIIIHFTDKYYKLRKKSLFLNNDNLSYRQISPLLIACHSYLTCSPVCASCGCSRTVVIA